ncbi:MAG: glycogen/starch synthase, partial [Clostridia bacterium]|nr:glycogen/starch synthase [Clostridia bacterium]
MKILFAASECVPFIKTGGLADVVGSLPVELVKKGEDARVVLPKYSVIDRKYILAMEHVCDFQVLFGQESKYCGVDSLKLRDVTYYFIDNQEMFSVGSIYGDGLAEGYRFTFFCRAVLEMIRHIDFVPDVLHLNDWQTGLIAPMLKIQYTDERLSGIKTVYSIHNLKYQGIFGWEDINSRVGFDNALFNADGLEFYGCLSFMKAGIVFSDHVSTVSSSYADEIKSSYYGERMDGLIRRRGDSVSGILNGIDKDFYNPATDEFIAANYDQFNMEGKKLCKKALQEEMGLDVREDVPI